MRKWDQVEHGELVAIIEYVKVNFDPALSRKIVELFHERMQDGEAIDTGALCLFMKHVFSQIISGRSADQAFGLKQIKGRYKRPDTEERDMQATAVVILHMRQGASWEDAVFKAVEQLELGERIVQRAYEFYSETFWCLTDETLLTLAAPSSPPP